MTRSDVLAVAPWLVFAAGFTALWMRVRKPRRPRGRRRRGPQDH